MDDVRGYFLGPPHSTTIAAMTGMTLNENIKVSSANIHKKEGRPDCTFSNKTFSLVTLSELAMNTVISSFNKAVILKVIEKQ